MKLSFTLSSLKRKRNLKNLRDLCLTRIKLKLLLKKIENLNNLHKKLKFFVIGSTGHSF